MLLVHNLSRNVTRELVQEIFAFFGKVLAIDLPVDERNHNFPLQYAFVHYEHEGDADQARQYMDKAIVDGKHIKCEKIVAENKRYRNYLFTPIS